MPEKNSHSPMDYGNLRIAHDPREIDLGPSTLSEDAAMTDASTSLTDPRFKSPDDLLRTKAPNRAEILEQELAELKGRYTKEIGEWKEYEKRVQDWKKQVMDIVKSHKNGKEKQKLLNEIDILKSALQIKDQELQRLRAQIDQIKKKGLFAKVLGL